MPSPTPFRERPFSAQVLLACVLPFVFGLIVGVILGISALAYWVLAVLGAIAAILAGAEHAEARHGALRGLVVGAVFGLGVLLGHAVAGTDAKVSLGSFPPFLIVVDAIVVSLLIGFGAWLAGKRSHAQ